MALVEYDLFGEKRDKVKTAIDRLQAFEPQEGYYVADSGGKDSTCVVKLCEMAGVKFDAHYHATTIDPPQLVRFIRKLDWTSEDVWEFVRLYNVPYCELYDFGFKRLGCVSCPLGGYASMQRDLEFFPQFKSFYIRTFDEMLDARRKAGKPINRHWTDGESVLRWWVGKGGESKDELQLGIFDETEG